MAVTITKYNSDDRHIGREPVCLVFDVDGGTAALSNDDSTLVSIPANTILLAANIQCVVAEAGATSSKCDLRLGSNNVLAGTADNGGTVGTVDDGVSSGTLSPENSNLAAAANLVARVNISGTPTTAPVWRVWATVTRTEEP